MPDRLSPLDSSFLFMEEPTTAMHVGGLMIFEPEVPGEFDAEGFVRLIGERLAAVPRYRQKIREVPGRLGLPVWVDDTDFDLDYHVRRSALPAPGSDEQLRELVGRLQGRRLDRARPLWEIYLVEGLTGGRFAVITKTHHAMVDGLSSVDIGAVLLDITPEPRESPPDHWLPAPEPSSFGLITSAVGEQLRRPQSALDTIRRAATDARATVTHVVTTTGAVVDAARNVTKGAPPNPLNAAIGQQRRYATSAGSSTTTRRSASSTAAPSTTWCSPWSRAGCAAGSRPAASPFCPGPRCARWSRSASVPATPRGRWATRSRRTSWSCPSVSPTR